MIDAGFCDCREDAEVIVLCRLHAAEYQENDAGGCEACRVAILAGWLLG